MVYIIPILDAGDGPAGKVFTAKDMVEDPHYTARENIVEVEDPDIGASPVHNVAPRLGGTPGKVRWSGRASGQHNDEVYGNVVGLSQEEREALHERGVI